ncbi:ABC transporter permease [Natronospirillum operosum]|uniref:Autoinducer 2 import system permease protein LsrC n=1 Tax=Natronospirillum operosum TaxID=2759953 RepID=A0A4Z0W7W1_9GAMM|nr:ABC transporter permease [Natronospirillum operosum]TGG93487.1 ABC transporter permease [Natronospirillum operosum]
MNSIVEFLKRREVLLGIVVLCMIAIIGSINPNFLQIRNLISVYNDTSILIILALGQMLVILTRCIDLSVAANLALTGMVVGLLNAAFPGFPVEGLIVLAVLMGACLGAINGAFVWLLGVPAIVVTLGTMSIYRGSIFLLSGGDWVNAHQMSPAFLAIPRQLFLGVPVLSWMSLIVIALMVYITRFRPFGRQFFAAGGNPRAAFYTGINVGFVQFRAFVISGALAGLCGYLWVSRYAVAYTEVANGFELQVVAACVIGGISIMGGVGTVAGAFLGALFLGIISNSLSIIGVSQFWQMAISGAVIIIAVIANSRSEKKPGRIILREAVAADAIDESARGDTRPATGQ